MVNNSLTNHFHRPTVAINYAFIALIFLFNFFGSPILKPLHLAYATFMLAACLVCDLRTSLHLVLGLCFVEGQGRIVWEYHPFFRLSFDIVLGVIFLRNLAQRQKITVVGVLPPGMLALLFFHLLWYTVEILNPSSLSSLAVIAASKIYVFPFVVFLLFRSNADVFDEELLRKLASFVIILVLLECALGFYQLMNLESLMLQISPRYRVAMKDYMFTGSNFRPFGTMAIPGAIASYLYLTSGFLFLRRRFTKRYTMLIAFVVLAASLTLFGTQVRSAMLKFGLIVLMSALGMVLTLERPLAQKLRIMALVGIVFSLFGMLVLFLVIDNPFVNLSTGLNRWKEIESYEDFKARRPGPTLALQFAIDRLVEHPIGIGPGHTGAASSVVADQIASDPIYPRVTFWGLDNLFLSLITEMGFGAFFYISLLLFLPVLLFNRAWQLMRAGEMYRARVAIIGLVQISVILLGNWMAIGIPYNPESFFFWFWTALSLNMYDNARNVSQPHPEAHFELPNPGPLSPR